MTTRIERRYAGQDLPGYEIVNANVTIRSPLGSAVRVDDLTFETVVTVLLDALEPRGVYPERIVDREVLALGEETRVVLFLGLYELIIRRVDFDEE